MKKMVALMLAALLALAGVPALAESSETLILTATVEGLDPIVLSAPASGLLAPFSVRAGQLLSPGETVFTVEPQRVCRNRRWRMCTHRPASRPTPP